MSCCKNACFFFIHVQIKQPVDLVIMAWPIRTLKLGQCLEGGPWFKSPYCYRDLFSVVLSSTPRPRCINSQLVSLPAVGIVNSLCSVCYIQLFIYNVPNFFFSAFILFKSVFFVTFHYFRFILIYTMCAYIYIFTTLVHITQAVPAMMLIYTLTTLPIKLTIIIIKTYLCRITISVIKPAINMGPA